MGRRRFRSEASPVPWRVAGETKLLIKVEKNESSPSGSNHVAWYQLCSHALCLYLLVLERVVLRCRRDLRQCRRKVDLVGKLRRLRSEEPLSGPRRAPPASSPAAAMPACLSWTHSEPRCRFSSFLGPFLDANVTNDSEVVEEIILS